jgi:hypothetical protein
MHILWVIDISMRFIICKVKPFSKTFGDSIWLKSDPLLCFNMLSMQDKNKGADQRSDFNQIVLGLWFEYDI